MCAGFVPQDFIKGCGVICDPSYLLHFTNTHEDAFDAPALPVTLMLSDFDINADREKYLALLADLRRGRPEVLGDSGKACPGGSGCIAQGMAMYSWYDIFCAQNSCSASSALDAGDIRAFLSGRPKLSITPIFRDFFPIFSRFPRGFWPCSLDSWRPDAENGRKMGENG